MLWLLWSLLAFAAAVAAHALACRLRSGGSAVLRYIAVGMPIGLALLVLLALRHGWSADLLAGALLYALLSELYLFLFTLAANSVGLGILRRLARAPLTEAQVAADYDSAAMVARRLDQLVAGGLLQQDEAAYRPTERGARTARSFARLRRLFRHEGP
ncbi:MAG: hypothetical protein RIB84_22035 [Sneathiellaceae bacterium]